MEIAMDFNRIRILTISLFIFTLCSLLFYYPAYSASRGISVISDLSHQSGKLGAYRALIIGINDYKDPKIPDLETAVNDAKAMAELLRKRYGFQVKLLLDRKATKKVIYKALRSLASSTKPNDSILIYYAGHGDLDRTYDDGWWIPADANGGDPVTYLDNGQIQKSMRSMEARHVLLISDSCYSGTLFGQARAMPQVIDDKYYLNLYNEKSRWGMTSGNKTPVSDRGSGGHSVFAYQLLKELRKNEKPYISTQEVYTRIAPIVGNNSEQTPLCRPVRNTGDQGGEFVFVASKGAPSDISVGTYKVENELASERRQLDKERMELERLKMEVEREKLEAERKRIEAEKKKLVTKESPKYASLDPSVTHPKVIEPAVENKPFGYFTITIPNGHAKRMRAGRIISGKMDYPISRIKLNGGVKYYVIDYIYDDDNRMPDWSRGQLYYYKITDNGNITYWIAFETKIEKNKSKYIDYISINNMR